MKREIDVDRPLTKEEVDALSKYRVRAYYDIITIIKNEQNKLRKQSRRYRLQSKKDIIFDYCQELEIIKGFTTHLAKKEINRQFADLMFSGYDRFVDYKEFYRDLKYFLITARHRYTKLSSEQSQSKLLYIHPDVGIHPVKSRFCIDLAKQYLIDSKVRGLSEIYSPIKITGNKRYGKTSLMIKTAKFMVDYAGFEIIEPPAELKELHDQIICMRPKEEKNDSN